MRKPSTLGTVLALFTRPCVNQWEARDNEQTYFQEYHGTIDQHGWRGV